MNTFTKVIAVSVAILFVVTGVLALFLFNIERKAFSASTYQQVFADLDLYDRLPTVIAGALDASLSSAQSELPLTMRGLSVEGWEAFIRSMLPGDVLKSIGDQALISVFAYLDRESDSAAISLAPLKRNMTGDAGVQAVLGLLANQPDCTLDQILNMTVMALSAQEIQFCNPPAELRSALVPVIQFQMQATAAALPDEIPLIKPRGDSAQGDPRDRLAIIRLLMRLSPLVPIGLLLLVTLLAVRSLKNWLEWWGIPLTVTGFCTMFLAALGGPVVRVMLQQALAGNLPAYLPVSILDFTTDMAGTAAREIMEPVVGQGLILGVVGLIMLLVSFLRTRSDGMRARARSEAQTVV